MGGGGREVGRRRRAAGVAEGERRRGREREGGKRHRDLIAVELSAKASGREQCSPRHSQGREGGGGGQCIYLGGLSEA